MSEAVARLPGFDPGAFEHQLFGLDPDATPVRRTRRRYPAVAVRAPVAVVDHRPAGCARDAPATDRWWRATTGIADPERACARCPRRVTRAASRRCSRRTRCRVSSPRASSTRSRGVAAERGPARSRTPPRHGLRRRRGGRARPRPLGAVARRADAARRSSTTTASTARTKASCRAGSGARTPRPSPPRRATYAAEDGERSPDALGPAPGGRPAGRRVGAARRAARRVRRAPTRLLLRVGRAWIARREVGKAGFLQAVDGGRAAARRDRRGAGGRGQRCATPTTSSSSRSRSWRASSRTTSTVPSVRAGRRASATPPWCSHRPGSGTPDRSRPSPKLPRARGSSTVCPSPRVGSSHERASCCGAADCATPIGPDEVLVTRTTDPSWVSMFLTAAGLVIDVGGPDEPRRDRRPRARHPVRHQHP